MNALFIGLKIEMEVSKMKGTKNQIILINGSYYHSDRPRDCQDCFFCKNRKKGCTLGWENCYYLAEVILSEQEKKCEGCPYVRGRFCAAGSCYKDLRKWQQENLGKNIRPVMKEGGVAHVG